MDGHISCVLFVRLFCLFFVFREIFCFLCFSVRLLSFEKSSRYCNHRNTLDYCIHAHEIFGPDYSVPPQYGRVFCCHRSRVGAVITFSRLLWYIHT